MDFPIKIGGFPVKFPLNQPIENGSSRRFIHQGDFDQ